jgi:predicted kinase
MDKPRLYLMLGYPGAGKTSVAKIIEKLTGAVRLSSDDLRLQLFPHPTYSQDEHDAVYKELDRRTEALLQEGKGVIYDANLNRYIHRIEKYVIAERTNARAVLVWVQVPRDLARERAVLRGHHHLVPKDETFESMFDRVSSIIEEPREDERAYTLDGTEVDDQSVQKLLNKL